MFSWLFSITAYCCYVRSCGLLLFLVFRLQANKDPHGDTTERTACRPSTDMVLWPRPRDQMGFWVAFMENEWLCSMCGKGVKYIYDVLMSRLWDTTNAYQFPWSSLLPQQSGSTYSRPFQHDLVTYFRQWNVSRSDVRKFLSI